MDKIKVKCVVGCQNKSGQPVMVPVTVACTPIEYDNGDHYAQARASVVLNGYEYPAWVADDKDPGFINLDNDDHVLSAIDRAVIEDLRSRGFAVIVWSPSELGDASPSHVQDRTIELGHDVIRDLQCDD